MSANESGNFMHIAETKLSNAHSTLFLPYFPVLYFALLQSGLAFLVVTFSAPPLYCRYRRT